MSIKNVQIYGQIRLDRELLEDFGKVVTLTLTTAGIEIAPYKAEDDYRVDCHIGKISDTRLNLPAKFRRQLNMGRTVDVDRLENGVILVRPHPTDETSETGG